MTPEQHVDRIVERASIEIRAKYIRGQREHGGRLYRKGALIDKSLEEARDLIVYLETLSDQHEAASRFLAEAIAASDWTGAQAALNILAIGNPEGEEEEDR